VQAPAPEAAPRQVDEAHPLRAVTRGRISDADFIAWIAKLEIAVWEKGQRAVLIAPSAFHRDWVRNYLAAELRAWMQVRVLEIDIRRRKPQSEGAAP
jgi:chromosomal replication initiation ATPase DnaA